MVKKVEDLSKAFKVPLSAVIKETPFSYGAFMRWRSRIRAGKDPLERAGPKKIEPVDLKLSRL